jgi:hypothetical protein
MKRSIIYFTTGFAAIALLIVNATQKYAHSNTSGAPTSGACTGCHSGSVLTSDNTFISITDTALGEVQNYVAGKRYLIGVGFDEDSAIAKAGFAFSATAGTFSKFLSLDNTLQITNGYVTHTRSGTSEAQWLFWWQAPATASAPVSFTLFLNEANNDNSTSGDKIYRVQQTLQASPTSIPSIFGSTGIHVFPNPAKDVISMFYQLTQPTATTVSIYSLDGKIQQVVATDSNQSGKQELSVPLENLAPGIYILRLEAGDEVISRKLVIQ